MPNKYSNIIKINYECYDNSDVLYVHEDKIKVSEYFKILLELSDSNELNLKFDFDEKILLLAIDNFYGNYNDCDYHCSFEIFYNTIKAFLFLGIDDTTIEKQCSLYYERNNKTITIKQFITLNDMLAWNKTKSKAHANLFLRFFKDLPKNVQEKYDDIIVFFDNRVLIKLNVNILDDADKSAQESKYEIIKKDDINLRAYFTTDREDIVYVNPKLAFYPCKTCGTEAKCQGLCSAIIYKKVNNGYERMCEHVFRRSRVYPDLVYLNLGVNTLECLYFCFYSYPN